MNLAVALFIKNFFFPNHVTGCSPGEPADACLRWERSLPTLILRNIIAQQSHYIGPSADHQLTDHIHYVGAYTLRTQERDAWASLQMHTVPLVLPSIRTVWADPSAFLLEFEGIRMKAEA